MRGKVVRLAVVFAVVVGASYAFAAPTFVGSDKCKICHKDQSTAWEASKHSKAWASLKPADQANAKCIECHTTGNNAAMPNVGCEDCHGAGSDYKNPTIMNKAKWTADPAAQLKLAVAAGLKQKPDEAVCVKCHNKNSPNFKGFDFAKSKEAIKHWK